MVRSLRILIVEDNRDLVDDILVFLEAKGHVVDSAVDGVTGLHLAVVNQYDAIVLDLMLPGMDGLKLCRSLRQEAGKGTPILMLTARDALEDKINGLEAGADDYMVKPAELRELETRLRVLARRVAVQPVRQQLTVADLTLDPVARTVYRGDTRIELPPIPFKMLELLMERAPQVVTREEMENSIWTDARPDSDALRAHLHVLRNLIDKPFDKPLLNTLRGFGYQLLSGDEAKK